MFEFPVNLVWAKTHTFTCVFNFSFLTCKNDVMPSKAYGIVDAIKNQSGTE